MAFSNETCPVSLKECNSIDREDVTSAALDFAPVIPENGTGTESFPRDKAGHGQHYLIQNIVDALLGKGTCPGTGHTAARTSRVMDEMVKDYYMNRSKRSLSALQMGQTPGGSSRAQR